MYKYLFFIPLLATLISCGSGRKLAIVAPEADETAIVDEDSKVKTIDTVSIVADIRKEELLGKPQLDELNEPPENPLIRAEWEADSAGRSVLKEGRIMALEEGVIFQGSCWDYINEVYIRAGYAVNRKTVFRSPQNGPYATISDIAPGDWIYHINYSYGSVHSGIFVYWNDEERMVGTTLSHPGENRNSTGRYRTYHLSGVYQVMRPVKK